MGSSRSLQGLLDFARETWEVAMAAEVALVISSSSGEDGPVAVVLDVLTGTQVACLQNCASTPGATARMGGDFVVSAQVCRSKS